MNSAALWIPALIIFFSPLNSAFAQEDARKLRLDTRKTLRLDYKSDSWNRDPQRVETNTLLIRDATSGRLARIEASETGPDTALFVGYYQINFDNENVGAEVTPEIYVVPQAELKKKDALKTIARMIKEGLLLRKPYFLRVESKNIQAISVYDNREQAYAAYEDFLKTGIGRPIVDRAALEAKKMAELREEERKQREEALKIENERARLEDDEKRLQAERLKAMKELDEKKRAERQARAKSLAEEAMALYQKEKFAEAEDKFRQSTEIDPETLSYHFQYGVTLYRTDKYNQSLVFLNLAQGPTVSPSERQYYIALNHLKLKEYDQAYKEFIELKAKNERNLSPASAFFAAVIDYQKENYDSAKNLFEYVVDTSEDPKLDQQAETYIEQIANIKKFQELQKKKIFVTANLGLVYDSNILAMNLANAPTNLNGFRGAYGGSVEYRALYTASHEFSGIVSLNDTYSLSAQFRPDSTLQNADALAINVKLPFKWKGVTGGKPFQLTVTPYFETIQLNADTVGLRETILNSSALSLEQTLVMSDSWFSNYLLEYRRDVSLIAAANDDENQTANKIQIYTTQTFFRDAKKSTAWVLELGHTPNNAAGRNQVYRKSDVAVSYFLPIKENIIWNNRLAFYSSQYSEHTTGRTDTNIGFSSSIRLPINDALSLNLAASYNKNTSTVSSSTYDKLTVASGLAWMQNF